MKNMNEIMLYHGSKYEVVSPEFGRGNPENDYGLGFYCTRELNLAKEWSVTANESGIVNKYSIDISGLKILNLQDLGVIDWLVILMNHRVVNFYNIVSETRRKRFLDKYKEKYNLEEYDIIIGYRADDSYFSFVRDFIDERIYVEDLKELLLAGNLGLQYVLKSKKAFDRLKFIESENVDKEYFKYRKNRDTNARNIRDEILLKNMDSEKKTTLSDLL